MSKLQKMLKNAVITLYGTAYYLYENLIVSDRGYEKFLICLLIAVDIITIYKLYSVGIFK